MKFAFFALLTLLAVAALAQSPPPENRFSRVAAALQKAINADDQAGIQTLFAPAMTDALPPAKSSEFFRGTRQELGDVVAVGSPRVTGNAAVLRLTFAHGGPLDLSLSLDSSDKVIGLLLAPPAPELPVPARNSAPLRLPFDGAWQVLWGGATEKENYHVISRPQKRAIDWMKLGENGETHASDGKKNADYYAYGQQVLAAGNGTVAMVVDGVPDNEPGKPNPLFAAGNCVLIRHSESEFSLYAHLKPDTERVKVGEIVTAGQPLGLCGNSGNSTAPHLHFHLQNAESFADATGFAPYFSHVSLMRGGKTKIENDVSPVKGDVVKNIP